MNGTKYADLHCDLLTREKADPSFYLKKGAQSCLEELLSGGCALQCYALFERFDFQKTLAFLRAYLSAKDKIKAAGIKPVLTIEGGAGATGEKRLALLVQSGVKIFGAVWNEENDFAFPCGKRGGLKPAGREAFEYLLSKGVYPDLSHMSDEGIDETLSLCRRKGVAAIATHSLCRSVFPHVRNLTDEQIKKIADTGGVVGACFYPPFIGQAGFAAHLKRLVKVGGEDVVAIGSDFDGMNGDGIVSRAGEMPRLFSELKRAGFSPRSIEKFAYSNVDRLCLS